MSSLVDCFISILGIFIALPFQLESSAKTTPFFVPSAKNNSIVFPYPIITPPS